MRKVNMKEFEFLNTEIEGLKLIKPFINEDNRGNFTKYYDKKVYDKNGIVFESVYEAFDSVSKRGVIRGLHFQTQNPQAKLVRVPHGMIRDVVVDLRKNSATYGKYHTEIISSDNEKILYVPRGFAHGFICLSDISIVSYLCDREYSPESDGGILWNDKKLNINWNLSEFDDVILSERDKNLMSFEEYELINDF